MTELEPCSAARARELVDTIRSSVLIARDAIVEAWRARAWIPLGYQSWQEMCETEFDGVVPRLPAEERRELAISLRQEGMSTRGVAAAAGVSEVTVRRDVAGASNDAPEQTISGLDGKRYRPRVTPAEVFSPPAMAVEQDRTREAIQLSKALGLVNRNVTGALVEALRYIADADTALINRDGGVDFELFYLDAIDQLADAADEARAHLRQHRIRRVK